MQRTLEWPGDRVVAASSSRTNLPFVLALVALLAASTVLNLIGGHSSTPTALLFDPMLAQPLARAFGGLALVVSVCVVGLHLYARRGVPLVVPYVWAFYGALALSDLLGVVRGVPLGQITSLFVVTALLLLASRVEAADVSRTVRNILTAYAVLNVLVIVALPGYAVQQDYEGLMGWRLHGLANHANSLAPYMVLLLCTLALHPYAQRRWNILVVFLGLSVLGGTQSKTTVILLAVLLMFALPHVVRRLAAQARLGLALAFFPLILAGLIHALISSGSLDALLSNDNVVSLTGRDVVWGAALDAWRQNPVFGYGYNALWNEDMGQAFATLYKWQPRYSHNLWVQVLGQAGYVGLMALTLLLVYLLLRVVRGPRSTRLLLLGILVTFFGLRGVSEVPIGGSALSDNTVIQLIVMLLVLHPAPREYKL